MPRSTIILRSYSRRQRQRASSSARSCTFEIPTDDPRFAGFTNIGNGSRGTTSAVSSVPRDSVTYSTTGSPRSRQTRFIISLSMERDDASTPAPT